VAIEKTDPHERFRQPLLPAFVDRELTESAVRVVERAAAGLNNVRSWLIRPPVVVDYEDDTARTVGAELQFYSPGSQIGQELPIDVDRRHLEEACTFVHAFIESLERSFAGNQLANSGVLAQQLGLTQLERVTGTPEQILQIMNRGRGGWPR
jgi:hypothetical protein